MMAELGGLIVQRRLHRMDSDQGSDQFFKAPVNDKRIRQITVKYGLEADTIIHYIILYYTMHYIIHYSTQ